MYVIFPADELIYLTYGAVIPRLQPRPTLDCLREPKVPLYLHSRNSTKDKNNDNDSPSEAVKQLVKTSSRKKSIQKQTSPIQGVPLDRSSSICDQARRPSLADLKVHDKQNAIHTFMPSVLPNRCSSNAANQRSNENLISNRNQEEYSVRPGLLCNHMCMNMSTRGNRQEEINETKYVQSTFDSIDSPISSHDVSSASATDADNQNNSRLNYYPTGALSASTGVSKNFHLEPLNIDPTQQEFGPGWGRPMSPMDLPTSSSSKITNKSRLRPKIHIPIGRLSRSSSSEQRESNRLREDLQLHVENPIFNSENLRHRNFDAFFESGEPVYKLQPKSPSPMAASITSSTDIQHSIANCDSSTNPSLLFGGTKNFSMQTGTQHSDSHRLEVHAEPLKPHADRESISGVPPKGSSSKFLSGRKNRKLLGWRGPRRGSLCPYPHPIMASNNGILKDYGHSCLNETLKSHNNYNFKLIKTVSDFTENLSQLYQDHAAALQTLVTNYRKKNNELWKERPTCHLSILETWEALLQETENDAQTTSDVAVILNRQVSRQMLEKSFHRKIQSRKVFAHRESFESIIAKTEEKLSKCRLEYKQRYISHYQNPTQISMAEYIEAHNAYVQQLHATNAMLETYHCDIVPQLMQELEEVHNDLYCVMTDSIKRTADGISQKAVDQSKRYNSLATLSTSVSAVQDLTNFVKILPLPSQAYKIPKWPFTVPNTGESGEGAAFNDAVVSLRDELIFNRQSTLTLNSALECVKREYAELEMQITQLQESIDLLTRNQIKSIETQSYNKVNELQEEISMKQFDLRAKEIHLAALRGQKDLYLSKIDPGSPRTERKFLATSAPPSMKTKWLKAFKSLKPTSGTVVTTERRNGSNITSQHQRSTDDNHHLQEYTYKKITACDVCSQILRGHTRQGLRCRICKLNAHGDCAAQLPRCQPKQKLLRRQKSTSELEHRLDVEDEVDISVQSSKLEGTPQDIPVVHEPDYPERLTINASSSGTVLSGRGTLARNVRPPPVSMPILGVQLQQQELQQQRNALPVPAIDVPSSSVAKKQPPSYNLASGLLLKYSTVKHSPCTVSGGTVLQTTFVKYQQPSQLGSVESTAQRRRMFAGFRPLSGFGRLRMRSSQHRSISLPETPHSPRRQKLNLRMKSLSLDSPESSEIHGHMRRRQPTIGPSTSGGYGHISSGNQMEHSTPPSNNSRLHSPLSPHQGRKLLFANRGKRGGSVELPDELEKSQSSASTSPCPSPKSHRLLPTNLYVILYNFKARHPDELDLKAGYKVSVIDTSDPDWWKGKFLGRVGFFPSKYCIRLNANEKPLQVTHNLQVSDGDRGDSLTLLRDQIVIQTGDEVNGMVMVRSADNRQGYCPVKYLQEV